ncbi:hypothetical protein ACHAWO_003539 [Cyclotella atomus]|uniref:Uncharacterized protein n=1 Tax=Cyclotella atomus TaxID=382360 RepID=A0ABD3NG17_9STRA
MMERQKNGQKKGWIQDQDIVGQMGLAKTTIRKIFAGMPDKYHNMKSGTQIYNAHQKLVIITGNIWKSDDELMVTSDEFWVEHPACLYILTVKADIIPVLQRSVLMLLLVVHQLGLKYATRQKKEKEEA